MAVNENLQLFSPSIIPYTVYHLSSFAAFCPNSWGTWLQKNSSKKEIPPIASVVSKVREPLQFVPKGKE